MNKAEYQNGTLMRWALTLQQYQFTVRVIKGPDNVGADYLSRNTSDLINFIFVLCLFWIYVHAFVHMNSVLLFVLYAVMWAKHHSVE